MSNSVQPHLPEDEEKHGGFSGKTVRFDVNIQSVKHLKLPRLTRIFLRKLVDLSQKKHFASEFSVSWKLMEKLPMMKNIILV